MQIADGQAQPVSRTGVNGWYYSQQLATTACSADINCKYNYYFYAFGGDPSLYPKDIKFSDITSIWSTINFFDPMARNNAYFTVYTKLNDAGGFYGSRYHK